MFKFEIFMEKRLMNKKYIKYMLIIFALNFIIIHSICLAQDNKIKIDKLITQYAESGDIHGTVLVAEAGTVIY